MGNESGREAVLFDKAQRVFDGVWVRKTPFAEGLLARVPRYVAEHLVATDGPVDAARAVARYFPAPDILQTLRNRLVQQGSLDILDHVAVRVDLMQGIPRAHLTTFGEAAEVPPELLERHPTLLGPGLWGRISLRYRHARGSTELPLVVEDLTPVSTSVSLEAFAGARRAFTLIEWVDLWLLSLGYHPDGLVAGSPVPDRVKWLMLSRLIPLVEPQYNLLELGPKNIGKTFLYRNATPSAFVVSGGMATPANLFVNLRTRQVGILGRTECVVFDEVGGLELQSDYGTMSILKDYMESGHFSRGGREYVAEASLVLLGNLGTEGGQPSSRYAHLLEDLPPALLDPAVVDRLHGFLPGWEIPKLTPSALAVEWGLASDYVGAVLHGLRTWPVEEPVQELLERHPLLPDSTRRDQRALEKTVRGLVKILFPDGKLSEEEGTRVLALASEMRQRVHQQLMVVDPGEFPARTIGFAGIHSWPAPDLNRSRVWDQYDLRMNEAPRPGEVTGLLARVNAEGYAIDGDVQVIEASLLAGSGDLRLTGFRGRAMEESARAAYHYLREHLGDFRLPQDAFQGSTLAVHLVSIDLPREGPSAGLAFLLAMVSAMTNRPVRPALAVTGEVALHGDIGPVGGLIPKLYAAMRHGRTLVLVPNANRADVEALPLAVARQLDVRPVATVKEALQAAFGLHDVNRAAR